MSLFSWFNSADQVDTALVVVAIIGAIIEVAVAVAAVINVHKELEESRKEKLEKYIEIFACIAAFFFLAEAILGCRSSMLLAKEIEKFKGDNLILQTNVMSLNGAVIQLAHQYDLSTNALAEANMRLASIKPLKYRLIENLSALDSRLVESLKTNTTCAGKGLATPYQYLSLQALSTESGADKFITFKPDEAGLTLTEKGQMYHINIIIKHPLIEP